ncbi:MAG: prepilin-type N-terminal cleavage/methylation domain-containing protein [Syntrophaceae bacterium]|nr:prepilin-type N-terminal cleavage/methylation domain-containing protein [Syntrophaceae bacterium]
MRNEKGFTLIEIIAVLVILGILAAVAVPKYIDMAAESKKAAAKGQVAEMKSTLNLAYAKYLLSNNGTAASTGQLVITEAGFTSGSAADVGVAPDKWNVTLTGASKAVTISVNSRDSDTGYNATGTWNIPQ